MIHQKLKSLLKKLTRQKRNIEVKNLSRLRQLNISNEVIEELSNFLCDTKLTDEEIDLLCGYVERIATQHFVRQMLKQEYGK